MSLDKKILVFGGTGFIGFNLVKKLAKTQQSNSITLADNLWRGKMDEELSEYLEHNDSISFIEIDLTNIVEYKKLNSHYDEIYLLSAVVGVKYTKEQPEFVVSVNSLIVLNVLKWLSDKNDFKLLFASTSEVYSGFLQAGKEILPTPEEIPVCINDILNPRFSYAASKIMGEAAVVAYARKYNFPATIVRYHNIYGPRMGYEHVIPELSLRILAREKQFKLYGSEPTRAFCFVSDAVEATIKALEYAHLDSVEIFHIGNDNEEIKIKKLLNFMFEVSDYKPDQVEYLEAPSGSPERRCPDISKLRDCLSFSPKVDLKSGLKQTFEWYKHKHPQGFI